MAESTQRRQRPTLAVIASAAGVSIATVSRVLDDHPAIKPDTKARVNDIARALGYPMRDPSVSKPLRSRVRKPKHKGSVCAVMPAVLPVGRQLGNPFELSLLGGIGAALRDHGHDFSISAQAPYDDKTLAAFMASHTYDGIIFLAQAQFHNGLNALSEGPRPFVVWGIEVPEQKYCSIGTHNFEGGFRATSHLIGLGRRHIAFVGHMAPITSAQTRFSQVAERLAGFKAAVDEADLPSDLTVVRSAITGMKAGEEAVRMLLAQGVPIDAIVASSDHVAIGAIDAIMQNGMTVPGDIAVVGYDDSDVAGLVRPRLTTVRQDTIAAGNLLVSKLLHAMAGFQIRSERLPTELVIRDSCGGCGS